MTLKKVNCFVPLILVFAIGVLGACEENPSDATISQFDSPKDVALICYDEEAEETLPLDCCKKKSEKDDRGECQYGIPTAKLIAFVTQTTSGEVAVVDLEEKRVIDQDHRIPYKSFIPVGGQPNDIVASDDGSRVYTANYETGDISVIRTKEGDYSVIESPYQAPARSIDLGGPASRISLVKVPEIYRDRVAIVTQPTMGRLAVVALDKELCADPEEQEFGCVKAYFPTTMEVAGTKIEMQQPSAMTDADMQSIYVGSYGASVVFDIQLEAFVQAAMNMKTPGDISPEDVVNEVIDISPYSVRSLSLEPNLGRWLYGIENDLGGVIAMDLAGYAAGSDPRIFPEEVDIMGIARSVKLVQLQEEGGPGPYTFNGTFAIVATTRASITIVDVEDNNKNLEYFKPHHVRSKVDLSEDAGVPKIEDDPRLSVEGDALDKNQVDSYLRLLEEDAGPGCDEGAVFKSDYDHGVRFRCDPYESRRENWTVTWQGSIGLSGVGVITNITQAEDGPWTLLNGNMTQDLCATELYTEGTVEGYPGDRLLITSDPTPIEGAKDLCEDTYEGVDHPLVYRVVSVKKHEETDNGPNEIVFVKDGPYSLPLLPECYGQVLEFEVRANEQWIVAGSRSGYSRRRGVFEETGETCVYGESESSELRLSVGETYENRYISFTMVYGEKWENGPEKVDLREGDTDPEVEAVLSFRVVDGYEEMSLVLGTTNITDIEVTPNDDLILIDQGGEGLVVFDLIGEFETIGRHVN